MLRRLLHVTRWGILGLIILSAALLMMTAPRGSLSVTGWARLVPIALTLILIIAVYFFSKELIGRWWGLLPTFLVAFSPNFLDNGQYPIAYLGTTLGIFATVTIFLSYFFSPSKKKLVLVGILFGATQLTSFSAFILVPYFLFLTCVFYFISLARDWRHFRAVLIIVLIGYALFYAVHYLTSFGPDLLAGFNSWLSDANSNLPAFLQAFSAKETIPALIMIAFAIGLSLLAAVKFLLLRIFRRTHRLRDYLTTNFAEFALLTFIIMYWLSGIGPVLPVLPFIYVLTAEAIRGWFSIGHSDKIRNFAIKIHVLYQELVSVSMKSVILAGLLLWYLISALIIHFK